MRHRFCRNRLLCKPDGTDNVDKNVFTFTMVKKDNKWLYAMHHFSSMVEENPEAVVKDWIEQYNKDNKAFFVKNCSNDFIGSNSGITAVSFLEENLLKTGQKAKPPIWKRQI